MTALPDKELREAIGNQYQLWLRDNKAQVGPERTAIGHNFDMLTDRLLVLFKSAQQQLLTELLSQKESVRNMSVQDLAVPIDIIENKRKEL